MDIGVVPVDGPNYDYAYATAVSNDGLVVAGGGGPDYFEETLHSAGQAPEDWWGLFPGGAGPRLLPPPA